MSKSAERTNKGSVYEGYAANYLQQQGLKVIATNYRSRFGEIDLIALDGVTLVFIEVKARNDERIMTIRETITKSKQKKLLLTARHYISQHHNYADKPMRFDFIGIQFSHNKPIVDWVQSAFYAEG